jgi:3D (Asp-Asp-Asp) domain-containing protein
MAEVGQSLILGFKDGSYFPSNSHSVFAKTKEFKPDGINDKTVYCLAYKSKNIGKQSTMNGRGTAENPLQLVRYDPGIISGFSKKVLISEGATHFYSIANMLVCATVCFIFTHSRNMITCSNF